MKAPDPRWIRQLTELGACQWALGWCRKQRGAVSAWRACRNGWWLEWVLLKTSKDHPSVWRRTDAAFNVTRDSCEPFGLTFADAIRREFPRPPKLGAVKRI